MGRPSLPPGPMNQSAKSASCTRLHPEDGPAVRPCLLDGLVGRIGNDPNLGLGLFAGAQTKGQVGGTPAQGSGAEWDEPDETKPVLVVVSSREDDETEDDAKDAIERADVGFHDD